MNCPSCRDTNLAMTSRSGIEVDYCPRCRGVWLDRGELDTIIRRSEIALADEDHAPDTHADDHQRRKHRRPWWAELFE